MCDLYFPGDSGLGGAQLAQGHPGRSGTGPSPGRASPQLQEAGRVAVDGAAQLVQRVVERHVRELL